MRDDKGLLPRRVVGSQLTPREIAPEQLRPVGVWLAKPDD